MTETGQGPNSANHFDRWADEGGKMLHFDRKPDGSMLVKITGDPSGPFEATMANFRVKQFIDWLIPENDAFNRGIASVMKIRCGEHAGVPLLNQNEYTGAECGVCASLSPASSPGKDELLAEALAMLEGYRRKQCFHCAMGKPLVSPSFHACPNETSPSMVPCAGHDCDADPAMIAFLARLAASTEVQ